MNSNSCVSATLVSTQFAETNSGKLAFRIIGSGNTIILCNRFRGILDTWDPLFLDLLAQHYRVVIFDYAGIGLSSGQLSTEIALVAKNIKDLADALNIEKFIIGGWSYGGFVAQIFAVTCPERISHLLLIGTNPPGQNEFKTEQLFIDTSSKLINTLEDEITLFFEPASAISKEAGRRSHERIARRITDNDIPVPQEIWQLYFHGGAGFVTDKNNAREKLGQLPTPVLVLAADHDIVFPVQNWFALSGKMKNLFLFTLPQAGHGPQHQYPELCVDYIHSFIQHHSS